MTDKKISAVGNAIPSAEEEKIDISTASITLTVENCKIKNLCSMCLKLIEQGEQISFAFLNYINSFEVTFFSDIERPTPKMYIYCYFDGYHFFSPVSKIEAGEELSYTVTYDTLCEFLRRKME